MIGGLAGCRAKQACPGPPHQSGEGGAAARLHATLHHPRPAPLRGGVADVGGTRSVAGPRACTPQHVEVTGEAGGQQSGGTRHADMAGLAWRQPYVAACRMWGGVPIFRARGSRPWGSAGVAARLRIPPAAFPGGEGGGACHPVWQRGFRAGLV